MHNVFLSALVLSAALDGGLEVRVRVSPPQVHVGEPVEVELSVDNSPSERVELAKPESTKDFEFLGEERRRENQTTILKTRWSGFAFGTLQLPQLTLEVTKDGVTTKEQLDAGTVEVVRVIPEGKGAELADMKHPEELLVRTLRVIYLLLAIAAVIAGLIAYRRYRKRPKPVPAAPPPSLEARTLALLVALEREDLISARKFREFYFRLSEVLRSYLGERFNFEALEQTTPELLAYLHKHRFPGISLENLEDFARLSDFVRYAKSEPNAQEASDHLALAQRIVRQTTPQPTPKERTPAHGSS